MFSFSWTPLMHAVTFKVHVSCSHQKNYIYACKVSSIIFTFVSGCPEIGRGLKAAACMDCANVLICPTLLQDCAQRILGEMRGFASQTCSNPKSWRFKEDVLDAPNLQNGVMLWMACHHIVGVRARPVAAFLQLCGQFQGLVASSRGFKALNDSNWSPDTAMVMSR